MNTKSNTKSDFSSRLIWIMGNTTALMAVASIYTQKDFDSLHIHTLFIVSFVLTVGYFLLRSLLDKGFYTYFLDRWRSYSKTSLARIMSFLCLMFLVLRFFLPNEAVYCLQIALYVAAGLFLIFGLLLLIIRR